MYNDGLTTCTLLQSGDIDKLRRLLDNKVDPNQGDYDQRTPLHVVCKGNSILPVVSTPFLNNAHISFVRQASAEGHTKIVELLIASKSNVNPKDRSENHASELLSE